MNYIELNLTALLIGCILDILIGDPEGWPHPVIWIGRYISFAEKRIRKANGNLRRGAVLLTASTILLTTVTTAAVLFGLSLLGQIPLLIGMSIIAWTTLSANCLAREGRGVARALGVSLEKARKQVGRIVGRDTASLTEIEIIHAAVETIAENTTDGVIAPMLYLLLGGPVAAMAFKASSTLDSMVGYLDKKYRDIGWSSAKFDDLLNWVPARICGFLMCLTAPLCKLDGRNAFHIMHRDHANHLSPNCAWSESAAAGALHIQLGGTHEYFGKKIEKPTIGDNDRPAEVRDILRTNRLMFTASGVLAFLAVIGLILEVLL